MNGYAQRPLEGAAAAMADAGIQLRHGRMDRPVALGGHR
jgi:hypothetical protein